MKKLNQINRNLNVILVEIEKIRRWIDDLACQCQKLTTNLEKMKVVSTLGDPRSPEARICDRFNANRRKIADSTNEKYISMSIADVRLYFIDKKGEAGWTRMVQQETERQIAEYGSLAKDFKDLVSGLGKSRGQMNNELAFLSPHERYDNINSPE